MTSVEDIQRELWALADPAYKAFQSKLMPTVAPARIIGVRTPALRKLAKTFAAADDIDVFLAATPHVYYEEDNVHAAIISEIDEEAALMAALRAFLPHIDNWATCDMLKPKLFREHPAGLPAAAARWLKAEHEYTARFGINVLMSFYLDDHFDPVYPQWVASIRREEYYIKMAAAWYFATALAKRYEETLPFLERGDLELWTHNKAIQKARESLRVPPEHKAYLATLRRRDP